VRGGGDRRLSSTAMLRWRKAGTAAVLRWWTGKAIVAAHRSWCLDGDGEDGAAATHHDMETRQPSREEDSEVSTSLEKMEVTRPFLPNTYGR
jgi:hypothetical protein